MSEKVAAISTLLVAGAGNLQTAAILIAISAIAIAVYKCKEKKRSKAQFELNERKKK